MQEETFTPDDRDDRALRAAFGRFATGITVVTIAGPDGPMGFIANSFSSVSLDPPLVLWALAKSSVRYAQFHAARHFAIHVLCAEQHPLISRFIRGCVGFEGLAYHINAASVPILPGALARFDCDQHATHDGGDHQIILGRVTRATCGGGMPLVFCHGLFGGFTAGN